VNLSSGDSKTGLWIVDGLSKNCTGYCLDKEWCALGRTSEKIQQSQLKNVASML
jgi:hypothetical protein